MASYSKQMMVDQQEMTVRIGFTGTRWGMSPEQQKAVADLVNELVNRDERFEAHHGDCIGADSQFHDIVDVYPHRWIVGHPGPADDVGRQAGRLFNYRHGPLPHMKRNRAIVDISTVMIATPFEDVEQKYGGTWKTIGMSRKVARRLAIVHRTGVVCRENWTSL